MKLKNLSISHRGIVLLCGLFRNVSCKPDVEPDSNTTNNGITPANQNTIDPDKVSAYLMLKDAGKCSMHHHCSCKFFFRTGKLRVGKYSTSEHPALQI